MRSHSHAAYTKIVITIFALAFPFTNATRPIAAPRAAQPSLSHADITLPVAFVENRGQSDPRVRYYARGHRFGFFLTPGAMTLALDRQDESDPLALSLRFVGANPAPRLEGAGPAGEANYFHGSDPAAWRTRVPQVQRGDLPWPVARHRSPRARTGRRAQVRIPRASGRPRVGCSRRLRRRLVAGDRPVGRAADPDAARDARGFGARGVPGRRRYAASRSTAAIG